MPPLSIMIKPASSLCNLRCKYCFYNDVSNNREEKSFGVMNKDTADNVIKKALAYADASPISITFQGGEPLIAGLDYFEHFVSEVKRLNVKNCPVYYSLQTNGTLLTSEWAKFLHENDFLVGLSLDGNKNANRFRVDENGHNSFDKIIKASRLLKKYNVEFNIVSVMTGANSENIIEIYNALKEKGFKYLQFIPCLRPFGDKNESEYYMTNEQFAQFLISGFTQYAKDYINGNYTSVRYFDNLVHMYLGNQAEQCGVCGKCTQQFVIEGNGNTYPCDFYCTDEWQLGNINEHDFDALANCERAKAFIEESTQYDEKCKGCKYLGLCRGGGCKRQRADYDYCEAYKRFYSVCLPLFRYFYREKK